MISAIVCVDENYGIGSEGDLLIHIKEDIEMFRKITNKGSVVMGRKTWDSLPDKPLKNRTNIIITRKNKKAPKVQAEGIISSNLKYIKAWLSNENVIRNNNGIFIIGGSQIYNELLQYCERIYLTRVFHSYNADVFFPDISQMPEWELTTESDIKESNGIQYQFCIYDRNDYEIVSTKSPENANSEYGHDMIITVKTFQGYRTVIIKLNTQDDVTVFSDDWEYLHTKENLSKFVDRVIEYSKSNESKEGTE